MQEDIEHRSVTMAINGGKFTGRMLAKAIRILYYHMKKEHQQAVTPQGKQSVKKLAKQNQGMTSMEFNKDENIRKFERIANKYGVDYAVKKVRGKNPKILIFFKAKDTDALQAAFEEFTTGKMKKRESRPSVLNELKELKQAVKEQLPIKNKAQEMTR